jgi:hypothetical protein
MKLKELSGAPGMNDKKKHTRPIALRRIIGLLECDVLNGAKDFEDFEVTGVFAADLMSDVLAFSGPGIVLLTGLTSIQSVHTADVADLPAIIYIGGKRPPVAAVEIAAKQKILLFSTALTMFEACGILFREGLRVVQR